MILLHTFLYYTIFASTVLLYGIGINAIADIGISKINSVTYFVKSVINIVSSAVLTWCVTKFILGPLHLVELFPLIGFLIFVCINTFLEALVRITTGISTVEYIVSFLIVLLSIIESTNVLNTIVICFSCFISMALIVPFCFTFKTRISSNGKQINERYYSILFIFLAILILMMSAWDIFWLNPGVIQ